MAQLVVRNLEDSVKKRLQRRAAKHGRSMEEEVRDILRNAAKDESGPSEGWARRSRNASRDRFNGRHSGTARVYDRASQIRRMIVLDTNVVSALMHADP
jgi:plasmid stability protein